MLQYDQYFDHIVYIEQNTFHKNLNIFIGILKLSSQRNKVKNNTGF